MTAEQLDLLALARATDPDTAHEAAASVDASGLRHRVLAKLAEWERRYSQPIAVSADLLADAWPAVARNSWSSRLAELRHLGLVYVVGKHRNERGRMVQGYELTDAGREHMGLPKRMDGAA